MKFLRLTSEKGLSLTELLVATVLIGVVMIGVASFTTSVKNVQDTTVRGTQVQLQLAAALSLMRKDFSAATGDLDNPGIAYDNIDPGAGRLYGLCSRIEGYVQTPDDLTDDTWVCWVIAANDPVAPLRRCFGISQAQIPNLQLGANLTNGVCGGGADRLFYFPLSTQLFFDIDPEGTGALFPPYIEINLQTRTDPNTGPDPMDNPEHMVTAVLSMPAHSRN